MDPRSNSTSGLGLPQPGNDMGQLPPIHTPQSFHAPDTAATHFDTAAPQIGAIAPSAQAVPLVEPPVASPAAVPPLPTAPPQTQPRTEPTLTTDVDTNQQLSSTAPVDDTDTAFDEEWVGKARQMVSRTHTDPFLQSQELSKLKAQYIKLRYNKDIKVE